VLLAQTLLTFKA